ncbi:MAG: nitrile hydratase subunit beta [Acuticoccus sp.]
MNGPHDLGGQHGFGPVVPDVDEPRFHAPWERSVFALTLLMGATGLWPLDRSRHKRESLPHPVYLSSSYYAIWLAALEALVAEAGVGGDDPVPPPRVLKAADVRAAMKRGARADRPGGPAPRLAVGDRVRVHPMNPATHTRAPRYVRGHVGTIAAHHGCHVLPDTNAHGKGENPVPLYNVRFEAAALWGPDTTASDIHVDLFEPYLEPA